MSNVEIARRGWEAAQRGDLDAMAELLDPEVKWHGGDPSDPSSCHNRTEALEFMRQAQKRGPVGDLVDILDAGDKVVLITRRLSDDGESVESANVSTFRDGKAIEMVHYENPDDARAAAGLT